jgi:hypothetical protein
LKCLPVSEKVLKEYCSINIRGLSIKYLNATSCKLLGQNKAVSFGRKTGRLLKADDFVLEFEAVHLI